MGIGALDPCGEATVVGFLLLGTAPFPSPFLQARRRGVRRFDPSVGKDAVRPRLSRERLVEIFRS